MQGLYNFGIWLFGIGVHLVAFFGDRKAKAFIDGRKSWEDQLRPFDFEQQKTAWFHCASLGEFEQSVPIITGLRSTHPDWFIVVTFFSPSGFEVKKDYEHADLVMYLPLDRPRTAKLFVNTIQPELVVFAKYEFWANYFHAINQSKARFIIISAIFHKNQPFFKWYGKFFLNALACADVIFTQDEASKNLISTKGDFNVCYAGDTRFDRVIETRNNIKDKPLFSLFKGNKSLVIGGSTWQPEEDGLIQWWKSKPKNVKLIVAPHDVSKGHIDRIVDGFDGEAIRYSELTMGNAEAVDVLVIDNVGLLASLYVLGDIGVIGGAFGSGLHNILEAATFGLPVIFGPKHQKFWEAKAILQAGGATELKTPNELSGVLNHLLMHEEELYKMSDNSKSFVDQHAGASQKIMKDIEQWISELK